MNIALIRHGKTEGNLRKCYIGCTDQPLCPQGEAGILQMVESGLYPVAQRVYHSPLSRCVCTGKLIYPVGSFTPVPLLRERHFGAYEGMTHQEVIAIPGNESWGMDVDSMVFPRGEDWPEFSARCEEGFRHVLKDALEHTFATVSVVCHGGTIMAVMERFVSLDGDYHQWMCGHGCGYLLSANDLGQLELLGRISL